MLIPSSGSFEPITPTPAEALLAQESSQRLAPFLDEHKDLSIQIKKTGKQPEEITLPASAFRVLVNALTEMAKGHGITLIPDQVELSTQQAADLMNVSRPFLVRLLDEGKIPSRKVGTHRRVLFQDLNKYNEETRATRQTVLAQLVEQAQLLDMGY